MIYAAIIYHYSKHGITGFECPYPWCYLVRGKPTRFKVLYQLVIHTFPILVRSYAHIFLQVCVSCNCMWMILVFVSYNENMFVHMFSHLHRCMKVKLLYVHSNVSDLWTVYTSVPVEFYFFKLYNQSANIYWEIHQQTQCVSFFVV